MVYSESHPKHAFLVDPFLFFDFFFISHPIGHPLYWKFRPAHENADSEKYLTSTPVILATVNSIMCLIFVTYLTGCLPNLWLIIKFFNGQVIDPGAPEGLAGLFATAMREYGPTCRTTSPPPPPLTHVSMQVKRRFVYRAAALLNRLPADLIEGRLTRLARSAEASLLNYWSKGFNWHSFI